MEGIQVRNASCHYYFCTVFFYVGKFFDSVSTTNSYLSIGSGAEKDNEEWRRKPNQLCRAAQSSFETILLERDLEAQEQGRKNKRTCERSQDTCTTVLSQGNFPVFWSEEARVNQNNLAACCQAWTYSLDWVWELCTIVLQHQVRVTETAQINCQGCTNPSKWLWHPSI